MKRNTKCCKNDDNNTIQILDAKYKIKKTETAFLLFFYLQPQEDDFFASTVVDDKTKVERTSKSSKANSRLNIETNIKLRFQYPATSYLPS